MLNIKTGIALLVLAQAGWTQGVIRLKTRSIAGTELSSRVPAIKSPESANQHYLVLFGSYPDPDVVAELQARHVVVLAYVPENALMVSATRLNLRGLDVLWSGPMDAADKLSPMVSSQPLGSYLVMWQPDTDAANNTELAENLGFTVIQNSHLLAGQLLVSGAYSALTSLAGLDQGA